MRINTGTEFFVDAVLFDMDGTLVASNAVVDRVWGQWAKRHALDAARILEYSHGRRSGETVAYFAPATADVDFEADWVERTEIEQSDEVVEIAGAARFLRALPPQSIAVVTSASRALAQARLRSAGLPEPRLLITAEDVKRGKPDPEGYLAAASALGVHPSRCLVLEDAPAGLAAGRAAGARVIAVASALKPPAIDAWDWVPDLSVLRVDVIARPAMRIVVSDPSLP